MNNTNSEYRINEATSVFLDFLRIICSQMVVIGHGLNYFDLIPSLKPPNFEYMQNIAVIIFFILSGFLIFYTIDKNRENTFKDFFINRFSRIYSGFIPALIFVFFIDFLNKTATSKYAYEQAYNIKTFVGNIFMLQDFPYVGRVTSFGSARPFWTIAVEWWIYLSIGWFILKLKKEISFRNLLVFFLLSIVSFFNLLTESRGHGLTFVWLMGALVLVVLKVGIKEKIYKNNKYLDLGLSLFFLIISFVRIAEVKAAYDLYFAFSMTVSLYYILKFTNQIKMERDLVYFKIIRFVAAYSFTLYLIHYSIIDLLYNLYFGIISGEKLLIISFFLSNIVALILAYFTEMKYRNIAKYIKKIVL